MRRTAVLSLCLALLAPDVWAQEVDLRFAPTLGTTIKTLTEVRSTATLFGFPEVPDGVSLTHERRVSATVRAVGGGPGAWSVEVVIDSVRARRRTLEGAWVDADDDQAVGRPARATVDERLAVTGIESAGPTDAEVLRLLGAGLIGLGFAFPDGPVAPGTTFPTGGRIQFTVRAPDEGGLPLEETVSGTLALTVDSVAASGSDELAFLRFAGALDEHTRAAGSESGNLSATFTGAYAGRLIWSNGWNAFVSAAGRVRVDATIRIETAAGLTDAAVQWDVTLTHQVRP